MLIKHHTLFTQRRITHNNKTLTKSTKHSKSNQWKNRRRNTHRYYHSHHTDSSRNRFFNGLLLSTGLFCSIGFLLSEETFAESDSIYDFTVMDIDGNDVSLAEFKGKVVLIVNVSSRCGLTMSNYKAMVEMYNRYKDEGFVVLAFPCNQFANQEPGTDEEIKAFAKSKG
eukprot:TRINITY_DN1633_c0_g1_i1.p2 TRINITY_DN1633_c0_g1~~TRINITY_DN1633_c0_g1_i1.p2  ORF type:complete len:185 (-),score=26.65 TRINITY_DN1633_c0_g1_i1:708-1214(-)